MPFYYFITPAKSQTQPPSSCVLSLPVKVSIEEVGFYGFLISLNPKPVLPQTLIQRVCGCVCSGLTKHNTLYGLRTPVHSRRGQHENRIPTSRTGVFRKFNTKKLMAQLDLRGKTVCCSPRGRVPIPPVN